MYDEVSNTLAKRVIENCPFCKEYLYDEETCVEWQTKAFKNILAIIGIEDIKDEYFEMHTICPHCGRYFGVDVNTVTGTYKVTSRDYTSDILDIADYSLVKDCKENKIKNISNKGTKDWLNSLDVGYDICEGIFDEDIVDLLHELADNYYIIPKEDFEDLE